jgi:hypothetical protein
MITGGLVNPPSDGILHSLRTVSWHLDICGATAGRGLGAMFPPVYELPATSNKSLASRRSVHHQLKSIPPRR